MRRADRAQYERVAYDLQVFEARGQLVFRLQRARIVGAERHRVAWAHAARARGEQFVGHGGVRLPVVRRQRHRHSQVDRGRALAVQACLAARQERLQGGCAGQRTAVLADEFERERARAPRGQRPQLRGVRVQFAVHGARPIRLDRAHVDREQFVRGGDHRGAFCPRLHVGARDEIVLGVRAHGETRVLDGGRAMVLYGDAHGESRRIGDDGRDFLDLQRHRGGAWLRDAVGGLLCPRGRGAERREQREQHREQHRNGAPDTAVDASSGVRMVHGQPCLFSFLAYSHAILRSLG